MSVITQTAEDIEFSLEKVKEGLRPCLKNWEDIDRDGAMRLKKKSFLIASNFVHWEGADEDKKKKVLFPNYVGL